MNRQLNHKIVVVYNETGEVVAILERDYCTLICYDRYYIKHLDPKHESVVNTTLDSLSCSEVRKKVRNQENEGYTWKEV